jgi:3-dehydroquinate synthase
LSGCADAPLRPGDRRLVVIDATVRQLHGERITRYFDHHGIAVILLSLRADESVKRWDLVTDVVDAMNDFGIDRRREPVIAIGGGVLLDVVGLAACTGAAPPTCGYPPRWWAWSTPGSA